MNLKKKIVSAGLAVLSAATMISSMSMPVSAASASRPSDNKLSDPIIKVVVKDLVKEEPMKNAGSLYLMTKEGDLIGRFNCDSLGEYSIDISNLGLHDGDHLVIIQRKAPKGYAPSGLEIELNDPYRDCYVITPARWGDLNYDGIVDNKDVMKLQQILGGWNLKETYYNTNYDVLLYGGYCSETPKKETIVLKGRDLLLPNVMNYTYFVTGNYSNYADFANHPERDMDEAYCRNVLPWFTTGYSYADLNTDGKVNTQDLLIMQQYVSGWNVRMGISQKYNDSAFAEFDRNH